MRCAGSTLLVRRVILREWFFLGGARVVFPRPWSSCFWEIWKQHSVRAASRGASAPKPPRATRSQPESIRIFFWKNSTSARGGGEGEAEVDKKWKKCVFWTNSVYTLAYCEWREAAPGLQPLRLPRPQAPTYPMNTHVRFEQNSQPKEQYRPPDPINHVYSLTGK